MRIFVLFLLLTTYVNISAQDYVQYNAKDSSMVLTIISDVYNQSPENLVLYLARRLKYVSYAAKTLEKNMREHLVVNLHQLDCTTYVENVLALYLCCKNRKNSFTDFCGYLQQIRYESESPTYITRLHYFSQWIEHNALKGYVQEIQSPTPPFDKTHKLDIFYMSKNYVKYPMLKKNPSYIDKIKQNELQLSGREYKYISKEDINNTALLKKTIHDGDIIAITTNRKGLDISHVGFAVWHNDGLHMLNASKAHHKVVEEQMTLQKYMESHPSQMGIRVIRIK